jgi:hypothetical protein
MQLLPKFYVIADAASFEIEHMGLRMFADWFWEAGNEVQLPDGALVVLPDVLVD